MFYLNVRGKVEQSLDIRSMKNTVEDHSLDVWFAERDGPQRGRLLHQKVAQVVPYRSLLAYLLA